jgi:protein-S-isoprenylcysteine O-methyltransferase Ste14
MTISPSTVLQVSWAVWLVSWLVAAAWSSPAVSRPAWSGERLYRLVTVAGAILLFGYHPFWSWTGNVIWQVGPVVAWTLAGLTLCGFAFMWWARITLGRLWSGGVTRKADHEIVVSGPYRLVRHPIYSGLILSVLASAVMRGTDEACAGAALFVLGLFLKARVEERFLRTELGEERYDAYARRVPMLVPLLRPR